ncbi:hypothetical protein TWF281_008083 [Arthrobotrys megalospora]
MPMLHPNVSPEHMLVLTKNDDQSWDPPRVEAFPVPKTARPKEPLDLEALVELTLASRSALATLMKHLNEKGAAKGYGWVLVSVTESDRGITANIRATRMDVAKLATNSKQIFKVELT